MKVLGLITARGGSKRLPGKNIKPFLGKPLLSWTIESATASGALSSIILSTDSDEIAEVGREAGIDVPFMRPPELATDEAGSFGVAKHAVEWIEKERGIRVDWIVLLEPTAPGHTPQHIRDVVELATKGVADSIVGISETPGRYSYLKQQRRDEKGTISRAWDGEILKNLTHRNQDIPTSYFINSAIYALRYKNLFDGNNSLWGNSTYGYVMDSKYAFDIDTEEDWLIAEVKMKILLEQKR